MSSIIIFILGEKDISSHVDKYGYIHANLFRRVFKSLMVSLPNMKDISYERIILLKECFDKSIDEIFN